MGQGFPSLGLNCSGDTRDGNSKRLGIKQFGSDLITKAPKNSTGGIGNRDRTMRLNRRIELWRPNQFVDRRQLAKEFEVHHASLTLGLSHVGPGQSLTLNCMQICQQAFDVLGAQFLVVSRHLFSAKPDDVRNAIVVRR